MDQRRPERATMTTTTAATSPLNDTRSPAAGAGEQAPDPLRDLLIHDIRTPLAAISGYAQLLLRRTVTGNPDLPGLGDGLRRIEEAATRVGHLLDELTDVPPLAHAEGTDRQREMIDLVDLVKRIAEESQAAHAGQVKRRGPASGTGPYRVVAPRAPGTHARESYRQRAQVQPLRSSYRGEHPVR